MTDDRRALFDAWSSSYDPVADGGFPFGDYERVLDRVAELVAGRSPRRVLELGIGGGNLTRRIVDRLRGGTVVGVDFSEAMAANARRLERVEVVIHDLSLLTLPPPAQGCDAAAMSYVLHELGDDDQVRLLALLLDSLAPGGVCVVGDVCFADNADRASAAARLAERWDPAEHYVALAELASGLAGHGLRVEAERLGDHAGVFSVSRS
jgi:putative AdoMet-dependent methyltransferase